MPESKETQPEEVEVKAEEAVEVDETTQKLIEAESDRKFNELLEKKKSEWEAAKQKEVDEKVAAAKRDAEQYAKMTEKERAESELQKRLKALEERERKLNERDLKIEIEKELKEAELPPAFSKALIKLEDNEAIKQTIAEIKTEFAAAVQKQVQKALRQETPEDNYSKTDDSINNYAKERNEKEAKKLDVPNPWAIN
ncbi:capsid assembly scaffolding protein Gp46 family protein [Shouchella lonarensis]|uniref:DUF4355 domain-containing protein n=1 Tax=Shouchella lonarensis TaxID=1464122 RepID=A0A1G6HQF0_9BACI|nr:DUF4355 domain-containing protein [Shouchella lonarensis]SDB96527.1 protein of unknown function [Shouchella lonarensis]